MPTSRYKRGNFSIDEVDEIPSLLEYALMVKDGDVVNGFGEPKKIVAVLTQYEDDLKATITRIRNGEPLEPFFVPDLWHITFGRASLFPKEEAELLYEVWTLGHCIGHAYMKPMEGGNLAEREKNGYPGTPYDPR